MAALPPALVCTSARAAALDAARRTEKATQRRAAQAERERRADAESLVFSFGWLAELMMQAALVTAGCH